VAKTLQSRPVGSLRLRGALTEEERMVQGLVAPPGRRAGAAIIRSASRKHRFPRELVRNWRPGLLAPPQRL